MIGFITLFWKPIAIGIAILALVAAIGFAKHRYDDGKREEGRAEIQPKLDASLAAERAREAETAQCVAMSKVQSQAVLDAQARAKAAQEASAAVIAKARVESARNTDKLRTLQALASAAPRVQSCEATLFAADAIARESVRARRAGK